MKEELNESVIGGEDYTSLNESEAEGAEDDKEESINDDQDEKEESEEDSTEEKKEDEIIEDKEEEKDNEEKPPQEKFYYFNGKTLTAEQLYQEAGMLQSEFTKRSQELSEIRKGQKPTDENLEGYDKEELKRFESVAKALGFVKKDELVKEQEQETEKGILNGFLEKHPEYKDPQNANKLFSQLEQYNTNLKYLNKSLEKAHLDLNPAKNDLDKDKKKAEVNNTKLSRMSVGVGSTPKEKETSHNYSSEQIKVMRDMGVWEQ